MFFYIFFDLNQPNKYAYHDLEKQSTAHAFNKLITKIILYLLVDIDYLLSKRRDLWNSKNV